jgi:hypothetical protein
VATTVIVVVFIAARARAASPAIAPVFVVVIAREATAFIP